MSVVELDESRLHEFVMKVVGDLGAVASGALVLLGHRLGYYAALAEAERPLTAEELAARTGTDPRYAREWLAGQAASGYVTCDPERETFRLTPEQALVFADPSSPVYMPGGFYAASAVYAAEERLARAFRTGEGMPWGEHDRRLFCGTELFFRTSYQAHLVQSWLPALDGVREKLERGAQVADVGCGHGVSTRIMAEAFPASQFVGFDAHAPSIERARELAREAGLDNLRFEVATAKAFAGQGYDLVTCFDCLHDMGDPVGAAKHVRRALKPDGTWMLVEPFAGDRLRDNLTPIGRVYYAFSTMICTPCSKSQEVGLALGAQAGERRLGEVVREGGFTRFRRAAETPFNLILEARP